MTDELRDAVFRGCQRVEKDIIAGLVTFINGGFIVGIMTIDQDLKVWNTIRVIRWAYEKVAKVKLS